MTVEMEVATPVDLTFDSGCSTPYISAPSSPQRHSNFFFSAPASPSRAAIFYAHFNRHPSFKDANFSSLPSCSSSPSIPFTLEENEKPMEDNDQDFEFGFSGPLEDKNSFIPAEELFHQGIIKPLGDTSVSFRKEERKEERFESRGRERNYVRKKTRSMSPCRVSDVLFEGEDNNNSNDDNNDNTEIKTTSKNVTVSTNALTSFWDSFSFSKAYRNWSLKNLLFRNASEGHASEKQDSMSKYLAMSNQNDDGRNSSFRSTGSASFFVNKRNDEIRNSSFRSTTSDGSVRSRRRSRSVSAHELHYKENRAVSAERKKKTFLPYKKGLLGCTGFDTVISNAIGN